MKIEALDIIGLKATKELLEKRIKKNEKEVEDIIYERKNFDFAIGDYRGDKKRECEGLITLYSEKLKIVEDQIEKKLLAIH